MKAPVSRNPEIVSRRILDAAQAEFMEFGYEAASTNRIAQRLGGSKATLFRYYQSKEALLEAVVRRIADRWHAAVNWQSIRDPSPAGWLQAFAVMTLEWILGDEPLFVGRLVVAEGHKFPSLKRIFERTVTVSLQDVLAKRLRVWARAGLIDCANATLTAGSFLDLVISGAVSRKLYRLRSPGHAALARQTRHNVHLFLHGCCRTRAK